MTSRPILFSDAMVRAILDGRKSQTRREVKWPCYSASDGAKRRIFMERDVEEMNSLMRHPSRSPTMRGFCRYGQPGDRLWVRETWAHAPIRESDGGQGEKMGVIYRADGDSALDAIPDEWDFMGKWKPSIHMPRWASRITLRITDVRAERLQDIREHDAIAEGATSKPNCHGFRSMYDGWSMDWPSQEPERGWKDVSLGSARTAFGAYINQIHGGPRWNCKPELPLWDQNPWMWVISFERVADTSCAEPAP